MDSKKNMIVFLIVIFGLVASFFVFRSTRTSLFPFSHSTFDSYVRKAMDDWHVPGVALAVIKGDDIAYMKCYGVLEEGKEALVNENTLFAIGSCSKAFTATALALLVDEKKLQWDDKVHTFLKSLQMPDDYMTRELTVTDMLSHRSGLAEVSSLWSHRNLSREELMKKAKYIKPVLPFRTGWLYNNIIFGSAGEIIPAVVGMSWDDFITERIFKPLHMTRSNTSIRFSASLDNIASPHYVKDNKAHAIPYHNIDSVGPAGAINSTIADMAQWVKLHVNNGVYNGARILSQESANELYSPHAIIDNNHPFHLYGLGLALYDYHGEKVIFHEGNIDGMSATFAIVPGKKLGVIILTNVNKGTLGKVILNTIFDKYFAVKPATDWNAKLLAEAKQKKAEELAEKKKREDARLRNTLPSLDLSSYAGTYHSDLYGDITISKTKEGHLYVDFLAYKGVLEHWHNDTFAFDASHQYPLLTDPFNFSFSVDNKKVTGVKIECPDEIDESFKKIS